MILLATLLAGCSKQPRTSDAASAAGSIAGKLTTPAAADDGQWLMAAKDYAYVQDAITKAEAFPDRTPYESYVIDRMKISLGSATNNNAMTVGALERAIASGRLTPEEKSTFMLAMAEIHYDMQDYKKSIPELEAYLAQAANPHAGAYARMPAGDVDRRRHELILAESGEAVCQRDLEAANGLHAEGAVREATRKVPAAVRLG